MPNQNDRNNMQGNKQGQNKDRQQAGQQNNVDRDNRQQGGQQQQKDRQR